MAFTEEIRHRIYDKLREALEQYAPPMVHSKGSDPEQGYGLIGNKPVPYGHDKKIIPGMFFASIANRKDSVAFYFFPAYMDPGMKDVAPTLWKCLKGKTCFHFKKEEEVIEKELHALLKKGVAAWKKSGYMK